MAKINDCKSDKNNKIEAEYCSTKNIKIGLIIGVALFVTSGVAKAEKDQLSAIQSEGYITTYSHTATVALNNTQRLAVSDGSLQSENGAVSNTQPKEAQTQMPSVKNGESNEQEKTATQMINLTKTYQNTDNAFFVNYPENWELDQSNASVVMFKKIQDGPGFANVNIQLVLTKQAGGKYANIDEYLDTIKAQGQAQFADFKVVTEHTENLPSDPDKIKGKSMTFTYKMEGVEIKQLQIILMSEDNKLFYMWGYTASSDQFDKNLAVSDAMLDSWKFGE